MELEKLKSGKPRSGGGSRGYWNSVFDALSSLDGDTEAGGDMVDGGYGERERSIDIKGLKKYLRSESSYQLEERTGLPRTRLLYLANKLSKADKDSDGRIVASEWQDYVNSKQDLLGPAGGVTGGTLRVLAYAPAYTCSPPTIFLLGITALQIVCYILSIFAPSTLGIHYEFGQRNWPVDSYLIYDPYRRREAWRFLTYMLLHGDHEHITFNCIMQLLVGIPLEMSQLGWIGSFRVAGLYLAGVILGSLGASVSEPNKYMLGASAGVYALIAAHLATLILNWKEDGQIYTERKKRSLDSNDEIPPSQALNPIIRALRLAFIVLFTAFDVGQAIYKVYYLGEASSTSYSGHAFGALSGLLIGVFLLENRKVEDWEKIFQWIFLLAYGILLLVFVGWHIAGTQTGWFPEQRFP